MDFHAFFYWLFVFMVLADNATTSPRALRWGQEKEGNPALRQFWRSLGFFPGWPAFDYLTYAGIFFGVSGILVFFPEPWGFGLLFFLLGLWVYLVWQNVRLLGFLEQNPRLRDEQLAASGLGVMRSFYFQGGGRDGK